MVTNAIRIFAGLLTLLGALNLLVLALSASIMKFLPAVQLPAATIEEATNLFGVGAVVYVLTEIAKKTGRGGGH